MAIDTQKLRNILNVVQILNCSSLFQVLHCLAKISPILTIQNFDRSLPLSFSFKYALVGNTPFQGGVQSRTQCLSLEWSAAEPLLQNPGTVKQPQNPSASGSVGAMRVPLHAPTQHTCTHRISAHLVRSLYLGISGHSVRIYKQDKKLYHLSPFPTAQCMVLLLPFNRLGNRKIK